MKKTFMLLVLSSLPLHADTLHTDNPIQQNFMQKYSDNKIAYHHGKKDTKAKISFKDKMTDVDKCVSAAVSKYPGHILSMEAEIENDRLIYEFDIKTKAGPASDQFKQVITTTAKTAPPHFLGGVGGWGVAL